MTSYPSNWKIESLDSLVNRGIIKLNRGDIISKRDIAAHPGDYPIYSSAKENNGMFGRYGKYMFDEEVITWSIDGGGRLFCREKQKFSVTNVGGILRIIDKSVFDYKFLFYALTNLHSQVIFDWSRKAHPSVIRLVYDKLPIPPLPEQHKIVEILEDHLSRLDAALADVKQAKFKAAQFRRAFIHEMTNTVEGSDVMNVLEICNVYQPKTISTKELIPDGEFSVYGANGQIGFYDKFNHEESEVTVTCRGATCGTVNVIPAMSWITGNAMVFSPKDSRIQKGYLEYVLRGMDWTPIITGTAQPQITRTSIKDVFINLPSPEIQHEIYMKLESALTQVTNASVLSETIESQGASLRRSLLNAAFTGQLTKEVASV